MTRLSQKDVRVSVYSSNNGTLRIGLRSLFYYLPPVLSAKDINKKLAWNTTFLLNYAAALFRGIKLSRALLVC